MPFFVAGFFVCLFVIARLIVIPFLEKRDRLERAVQAKTKTLNEMIALKAEYDNLKRETELSENLFAKKKGFTLFSFLDKLAGETGIKERIKYMKPSKSDKKDSKFKQSQVEMKLQGINMKELTPYIHKIETSKNSVFIRKISIRKKGKGEGFIDVILQIETFEI